MILQEQGKKLKAVKDGFYSYKYCRVQELGVSFNFSLNEIEIRSAKETTADQSKIEEVIVRYKNYLHLQTKAETQAKRKRLPQVCRRRNYLQSIILKLRTLQEKKRKKKLNR